MEQLEALGSALRASSSHTRPALVAFGLSLAHNAALGLAIGLGIGVGLAIAG